MIDSPLEKQLAAFLRKKRGEAIFAEFSRKLGHPPSTLHRLEQSQQGITLRSLQQIMSRLKCDLLDIFPPNERNRLGTQIATVAYAKYSINGMYTRPLCPKKVRDECTT